MKFVPGNYAEKYHSDNLITKVLMNQFIKTFESQLDKVKNTNINNICEIGCAEGELLKIVNRHFPEAKLYACDIAKSEIDSAKKNTIGIDIAYSVQDAEKLNYKDKQFDLVICCEVLEHLHKPNKGLKEIQRIGKAGLVSVPIEPLWRILNVLRFKYLGDLGNTPGHLNHWSIKKFENMIQKYFKIKTKKMPLPWQMYLIEP